MLTTIGALLLSFVSGVSAAATPRVCTELGCESGVFIDVDKRGQWVPGTYLFHFILDGREVRCEGELPLPPCGTNAIHCDREGRHDH